MSKFKVGDKVKYVSKHQHSSDKKYDGRNGVIQLVSPFDYTILFPDDKAWIAYENELELINKTMNDINEGDIILDSDGNKRKVLLRQGVVVILGNLNESRAYTPYSIKELENDGWKLHTEPEVKEMTVEEVSKLVGKTVKIIEKK